MREKSASSCSPYWRLALVVPCSGESASVKSMLETTPNSTVGVVELAFFDARDHVGELGLRLGRGHLAALHLVQHLLGLGRPGLAGVKALALHEAEIGALENRALDGVGVAAELTLLDIAVAAGHIAAAGLLGRLHRMLARAAKHAVAAAA